MPQYAPVSISVGDGRCGRLTSINVVVAARYRSSSGVQREDLKAQVVGALRDSIIPKNPLLSCVILDGRTEKPRFKRVSVADPPVSLVTEYDSVQDFLRREHDDFPTNERLWRVSLLAENSDTVWISFAFHHAIGDGTSGLIFHNQLLEALEGNVATSSPISSPLPPALEDCGLDIQPTWSNLLTEVINLPIIPYFVRQLVAPRQDIYLGKRTSIEQRQSTTTGLVTRKLSPAQVTALRVVAKANQVSIHALLHATVAHSIRTELAVTSSTPISLRPLLLEGQRKNIANYISAHFSAMPIGSDILSTAKLFYAEINKKEARALAMQTIGKLQYLTNSAPTEDRLCGMEQYYIDKLTTTRDSSVSYTFEISNLGNWTLPDSMNWKIDDVHFTGSNSTVGELFNLGVVTLHGGLMNISCTWRTGYVDEEEVINLLDDVESSLLDLTTKRSS